MKLQYIDDLKDERVACYSVLAKVSIKEYLEFIKDVYGNRGGIEGQRGPLKTKSAQRIRKRLVSDLVSKAVIPPIVIGISIDDAEFENFEKNVVENISSLLEKVDKVNQVSIIDGMQRSTALLEAQSEPNFDNSRQIRLEFWVAKSANALLYRMLVLNTGQIPWNLKRQLEVVFSQFKTELERNIKGLVLFQTDENESRKAGGQYQASQFIELFMLFGTRRVFTDIQEELAEEFARLDIIETSGNAEFTHMFYSIAEAMVKFDMTFSKVVQPSADIVLNKFKTGKSIFSSQPARAGFVVAAAQEIFGLPGMNFDFDEQRKRYEELNTGLQYAIKLLDGLDVPKLEEFLELPTLDEKVSVKTSKVGEFERNFFMRSFKVFFELAKNKSLTSMAPCWSSAL